MQAAIGTESALMKPFPITILKISADESNIIITCFVFFIFKCNYSLSGLYFMHTLKHFAATRLQGLT